MHMYLNLDQPHDGHIACGKVAAPYVYQHEDDRAGQEGEAKERQ